MDLKRFEQVYGEEGGALYCPALMLKVWLYAYAVGITSARRLEQRIREDLGLRYLAGRSAAGQLGVECVSTAARAGTERRLYAGAGDGAADEVGTIGTGGDRLDADSGGGFAQPAG